jgi:F0F1-type ATP synthase membrane subunit c/vacuolar-type H+-ATPase subunit K
MDEIAPADRRKKWFLWGILLTGISSVPLVIGIIRTVRAMHEVSGDQATGLAAVSGGFVEVYAIFGLVLALLLPFTAIVLLARSFAEERKARAFLAVICICWSALMLAIPAWTMWFVLDKQLLR